MTKLLIRFQKRNVTLGQASAFQPLLKITQNETNQEVLDVGGPKARPGRARPPSAAAQPVSRGAPRAGREGPVTTAGGEEAGRSYHGGADLKRPPRSLVRRPAGARGALHPGGPFLISEEGAGASCPARRAGRWWGRRGEG